MDNIDEIYRNLTGIDIVAQKRIWDERGKGYYGEYLTFCNLYPNLSGVCKILMNLQIPTANTNTTELDLLLIHETGLYIFEIKHYKGTIYGKTSDLNWTQYFRTAPNNKFYNPVKQNQHHIDSIKRLFPGIPIHSFIVFTNPECILKVDSYEQNLSICTLNQLDFHLHMLSSRPKVFDLDRIDKIFRELIPYSPIMQHTVTFNSTELPFYQYVNMLASEHIKRLDALEQQELALDLKYTQDASHLQKRLGRIKRNTAILCATFAFFCILICNQYRTQCTALVDSAEKELSSFSQKFNRVVFPIDDITYSPSLLKVANLELEPSKDIENAVHFSCSLLWNGDAYGISIGENASIIIILQDGSVLEANIYNDQYPYTSNFLLGKRTEGFYKVQTEGTILPHIFPNLNISDISYIKIANLGVWIEEQRQPHMIAENFEIEIYDVNALQE